MPFPADASYRTCPWCNTQNIAMTLHAVNTEVPTAGSNPRQWNWLSCPRCGGVISIETSRGSERVLKVVPEESASEWRVNHLPDDVQQYYSNAQTVLNAGVPSSAAVELRKTLEAAAQHQGINEQPLVKAIKKMADEGLITSSFTGVLGHIRKVGNVGAHATDQQLSIDEVQKAMTFTTQVLRNLFEMPKELELLGTPADATPE